MQAPIPRTWAVLEHGDENQRVRLSFCGPCAGHHRLLRPDDPTPQERTHAVWLQRERPEPSTDHPHGPCDCGGFHRLLVSHPDLHHSQNRGRDWPEELGGDGVLAPVHCTGLHQQQPEPCALRLSGWELQEVLQGPLPAIPLTPGAEQFDQGSQQHQGARDGLRSCTDWEATGLTAPQLCHHTAPIQVNELISFCFDFCMSGSQLVVCQDQEIALLIVKSQPNFFPQHKKFILPK